VTGSVFYIYEHWRPDTNRCFYVGKGKNRRAWKISGRKNSHHKNIVEKLASLNLSVEVKIVLSNLSEQDAYDAEVSRIAIYGVDNLSNMTLGGEGMKNPTPESRKRMSIAQKKRFRDHPEEIEKMSKQRTGRIPSEETKRKISKSLIGKKHTEETKKKLKVIAKIRGVSEATREAHRKAVTGRKRPPFSEETIIKMKFAAKEREAHKRANKVGP